MNVKKNCLLFFVLIFLVSIVSAAPPVTTVQQFPEGYYISEQQYHVFKLGESVRYGFLLENASNGVVINESVINYCRLIVSNSQGFNTQSVNITYNDTYRLWGVELNETQVNEIFPEVGFYNYAVSCQDDFGGVISGVFEVTMNGYNFDIFNALSYFILILFFTSLLILYSYSNNKINYDKWENKIIKKYENKNYIKLVLSSIGFNLLKNKFVLYYLLGIPLILIVTELSYVANVTILSQLMNVLSSIYLWCAVLIGLYFFGYVQEWLKDLFDKFKDLNWGMGE